MRIDILHRQPNHRPFAVILPGEGFSEASRRHRRVTGHKGRVIFLNHPSRRDWEPLAT